METLRFRNYRCFDDTGDVEIKPITVLIGANSSGKSSFLKFFPLMKQSMGEMVNGIFLWAGKLVDLKNFDNTVKSGQDEIIINYGIESLPLSYIPIFENRNLHNVMLEFHIVKKDEMFDYLNKLIINADGFHIVIDYFPDNTAKIEFNSIISSDFEETVLWDVNMALIPKLYFVSTEKKGPIYEEPNQARTRVISALKKAGIDDENIRHIMLQYRRIFSDKENLRRTFGRLTKKVDLQGQENNLMELLQYSGISRVVDSINNYFLGLSKKMTYVKPLRAIAERYYRFQNYSVQEIDEDGKNLPMFYNSLSQEAFDSLNTWFYRIFGFTLELRADAGHLEMLIKEEEQKEPRNLADLGFGYTQILPILTILWKVIVVDCVNGEESYDYCKTHIVAIEQPELHLHPRYQGLFVEMLGKVIEKCKQEKKDIRILIETHSEIIINRLGKLIADSNSALKEKDVNVVIFNGVQEKLGSYVVQAHYDQDGYIDNWPYGFFSDYVDRN